MLFYLTIPRPPISTRPAPLSPYAALFRSKDHCTMRTRNRRGRRPVPCQLLLPGPARTAGGGCQRHSGDGTRQRLAAMPAAGAATADEHRSEEHTSELQSLMRISYAVSCLKKQMI